MKNRLPKYWVVKNEEGHPNWHKVIEYLNTINVNEGWEGSVIDSFYGYDGNENYDGTNCWDRIELFINDPVILTIEEFVELSQHESVKNSYDLY